MPSKDSCIVRHFRYYRSLSEHDQQLVEALEKSPLAVTAGSQLWEERDPANDFLTLSEGWAYSYRQLEDGSRQILEVYLPGDVIGLREYAFHQRLTGVRMIEDGVVCRFPHDRLDDIFRQSPNLTAILFAMASRQQVLLTERLVNLSRRSARQKLAHFIMEMYERLAKTAGRQQDHALRLPLSQEMLADVLGLSPVHVSRTFTALDEEGLIHRSRHRLLLPDPAALADAGQFDKRYLADSLFAAHR
ncbi:Crp/Fnr family transcriptional regulator [Halomonas denitrificans]|uniref:Crp/Fnr family transcriptional regulator n=1 Tax=Halomonas denitrificans TaxID=370769 RepID=UPI001C99EBAD|nr:Crp/Fnr family transcriptional regulator [Halomonas denitrificans]MBY5967516.1 Crp/Fnr family transcriptional regulator [Halomonas denitrificans]